MKKLSLIMSVLLAGLAYVSCEKEEEQDIEKVISLTTPPANTLFDLATVSDVSFAWKEQGAIEGNYKWLLSKTDDLKAAKEKHANNNPFVVSAEELEQLLEELGIVQEETPEPQTLYWSIVAGEVKAKARPIKLVRKPLRLTPEIALTAPPNSESFDLQKVTGVNFRWSVNSVNPITDLVLVLDDDATFANPATYTVTTSPFKLNAGTLDSLLMTKGVPREGSRTLHWSVWPADAAIAADTYTRSINLTRIKQARIALSAPENGADFDLTDDGLSKITFAWEKIVTSEMNITNYVLEVSADASFTSPAAITVNGATSHDVLRDQLTTWIIATGTLKGQEHTFYWSVKPETPGLEIILDTLRFDLRRRAKTEISLNAPAADETIDLLPAYASPLEFTWDMYPTDTITKFQLVISENSDLSGTGNFVVPVTASPATVTGKDLDDWLSAAGKEKGSTTDLYWSIRPVVTGLDVTTHARPVKLTRVLPTVITLNMPAAEASINTDTRPDGIIFTWTITPSIDAGLPVDFVISADNFASSTTHANATSPATVTIAGLEKLLNGGSALPEKQHYDFYWKVVPHDAAVDAATYSQHIDVHNSPAPTIAPTAPATDVTYDLLTHTANVDFGWTVNQPVTFDFNLVTGRQSDLSDAATHTTVATTASSITLTPADFDALAEAAGIARGASGDFYWSIYPAVANPIDNAKTTIRKFTVIRRPFPIITVTAPGNNTAFDLNSLAANTDFTWTVDQTGVFSDFNLVIGKESDLSDGAKVKNGTSPISVTPAELDALAKAAGVERNSSGTFYWSILPGDAETETAITDTNKFSVTRKPAPTITLTAPANNATAALATVTNVNFGWTVAPTGVFTDFKLVIGKESDLSDGVAAKTGTTSPINMTAAELDAVAATAGGLKGHDQVLYWSIQPNSAFDPEDSPTTYIRKHTVTRIPAPAITLTGPNNNTTSNLNSVTSVNFTWNDIASAAPYKLILCKDNTFATVKTVENITTASYSLAKNDLLGKLLELGFSQGTTANQTVYWKVDMQTPDDQVANPSASRTFRVSNFPTILTAPANNAAYTLDYKTPSTNVTTFTWVNVGATQYELLFSKNANMSNPVVVPVTGTSKAYTHQELQTALIGSAVAPKKYKTNTVYWSVRIAGQTSPLTGVTPRAVKVGGYRYYVYPNTSANTYEVTVVTLTNTQAGKEVVWMTRNLNETVGVNDAVLATYNGPAFRDPPAGWLRSEYASFVGKYYNNFGVQQDIMRPLLIPSDCKLPIYEDFMDVINEAVTTVGWADQVLAQGVAGRGTNAWGLNFTNHGLKANCNDDDSDWQQQPEISHGNEAPVLIYAQDFMNPNTQYNDFVDNGVICVFCWGELGTWKWTIYGMLQWRLMYTGDDDL
ncbi:MAG: SusE domain-containing protein [Prevotellaceae bacterium]|jgi:hypothetical protein|nr:SusE domain-containing protein [Prevotellaceae bacterium]